MIGFRSINTLSANYFNTASLYNSTKQQPTIALLTTELQYQYDDDERNQLRMLQWHSQITSLPKI